MFYFYREERDFKGRVVFLPKFNTENRRFCTLNTEHSRSSPFTSDKIIWNAAVALVPADSLLGEDYMSMKQQPPREELMILCQDDHIVILHCRDDDGEVSKGHGSTEYTACRSNNMPLRVHLQEIFGPLLVRITK